MAMAARPLEISLRHFNSWRTEETSDHIRWGATSCSLANGSNPDSARQAVTTTAASTTTTQRPARDERIAASTSGICSPVSVRRHPAGNGKVAFIWVSSASSSSSIRCWVPILVALSRPDLIQRRTVSGSPLLRQKDYGTVNIVALYYNNSDTRVQQRRR